MPSILTEGDAALRFLFNPTISNWGLQERVPRLARFFNLHRVNGEGRLMHVCDLPGSYTKGAMPQHVIIDNNPLRRRRI